MPGRLFSVQLGQYRDHLLHLKSRWASTLAPAFQFDSHVIQASQIASELIGHPGAVPPKSIYMVHDSEEANNQSLQDDPGYSVDDDDDDEPSNEDDASALIVSDIFQADKDDNEDTSNIEFSEDALIMTWIPPVSSLPSEFYCGVALITMLSI